MQCPKCGRPLVEETQVCPYCRETAVGGEEAANSVKVLSPKERDQFAGITLGDEQQSAAGDKYYHKESYGAGGASSRIYVKQVSFGSLGSGILGKIFLWGGLLVVAGLLLLLTLSFILPVLLVVAALALLLYFLFR